MGATGNMLSAFHDYEVMSIEHNPSAETLALKMRSPSGGQEKLLLQGCTIFRINDFIHQNVVYELSFTSGAGLNEDLTEKSIHWATSLSDSPSYMTRDTVTKILNGLRSGELTLVDCVPSYGAEIVALCRSFVLTPIDSTSV